MLRLPIRRSRRENGSPTVAPARPARARWSIVAAVTATLLLLGALALVYWKTRPLNEQAVVEISGHLRVLKELEARWDTILLRATTDTERGYESAVNLVPTVGKTLRALQQSAARLPTATLREKLPDIIGAFQEKNAVTVSFLSEANFVTTNLPEVQQCVLGWTEEAAAAYAASLLAQNSILDIEKRLLDKAPV